MGIFWRNVIQAANKASLTKKVHFTESIASKKYVVRVYRISHWKKMGWPQVRKISYFYFGGGERRGWREEQ